MYTSWCSPLYSGPSLSKRDEEALRLVQDADYLEFDGKANEAAECWSKAFKMSPALEAHFNGGGLVDLS